MLAFTVSSLGAYYAPSVCSSVLGALSQPGETSRKRGSEVGEPAFAHVGPGHPLELCQACVPGTEGPRVAPFAWVLAERGSGFRWVPLGKSL